MDEPNKITPTRLPAEAALGPNGAIGAFIGEPGPDHLRASEAAMRDLAKRVSAQGHHTVNELQSHSIQLVHLKHSGFLSMALFGFSMYAFNAAGDPITEATGPVPITYAVTVNHPVALQVEHVLAYLGRYVARQRHIAKLRAQQAPTTSIDLAVQEVDAGADSDLADVLRRGWQAAAEELRGRASQAGIALRVSYAKATITTREQLALRLPWLKRAYNKFPAARDAIDRTVALMGPGRLHIEGGAEEVRLQLERSLRSADLARFITQSVRDSFVCGNGYLELVADLTRIRVLAPERVELRGKSDFVLIDGAQRERVEVLHNTGISQLGSRYGVSVLEPMIAYLIQAEASAHASDLARRMLKERTDPQYREWAERTLSQAERIRQSADDQISRLISPAPFNLPDPPPDLYFAGQKLYRLTAD